MISRIRIRLDLYPRLRILQIFSHHLIGQLYKSWIKNTTFPFRVFSKKEEENRKGAKTRKEIKGEKKESKLSANGIPSKLIR